MKNINAPFDIVPETKKQFKAKIEIGGQLQEVKLTANTKFDCYKAIKKCANEINCHVIIREIMEVLR